MDQASLFVAVFDGVEHSGQRLINEICILAHKVGRKCNGQVLGRVHADIQNIHTTPGFLLAQLPDTGQTFQDECIREYGQIFRKFPGSRGFHSFHWKHSPFRVLLGKPVDCQSLAFFCTIIRLICATSGFARRYSMICSSVK